MGLGSRKENNLIERISKHSHTHAQFISFLGSIYYPVPLSLAINIHWLELPLSRTYFHGSKVVRAIEVLLYIAFQSAAFGAHKV